MEDKQTANIMETAVFSIVFSAVSIGCSFGISYLESKLGLMPTLLLLVISLLLAFASTYFAGIVLLYINNDSLDKFVDDNIENIQDRLANNMIINGVYREQQLALMERTNKFGEIWLISPDLLTEINGGVYAGVVQKNLIKGTKYKYFVPQTPINEIRVKMFKKICNWNTNLEIYYLSDNFFFLVPDVDFAIYEPLKSVTDGKQGYMGLQIQCTSPKSSDPGKSVS